MYEARQNKEKVSRSISSSERRSEGVKQTIQLAKEIEAYNILTGSSVKASSANDKPDDYSDFSFIFDHIVPWYYPKKGIQGGPSKNPKENYYKREPYFCAEPHALFALWSEDKKQKIRGTNISKQYWLLNVDFPNYASENDEINGNKEKKPCKVCSQWLDIDLPMKVNPEFVPEKEEYIMSHKMIKALKAQEAYNNKHKQSGNLSKAENKYSILLESDNEENDTSSSDMSDSEKEEYK